MKSTTPRINFLTWCALTGTAFAQTALINATFDGVANDTNGSFQIISNTQANGSGASWNQTTGFVNRGTASNSTAGAVSTTTINIPALGGSPVVLTVDVQAATGTLASNGMFIGFQQADGGADAGTELWNNLGPAFGLVIDGGSRLGTNVIAPGGFGSTAFQAPPAFGSTTSASINDGFKVVLTLTSSGWQFSLTGLQTAGGAAITGGSGTWADVPFAFASFTSGMRVAFTTQGNSAGTLGLTRVTVVGSPSTDTDNDGMPDSYEDANGLNKNSAADASIDNDTHGGPDGLTNLVEYQKATDPQDSDTDNDNLKDGDEVHGTLNPWDTGISGSPPGDPTDPLKADSDGDGINDGMEIANGTDPNFAPNTGPLFPFVDTDGDTYSDTAELAFGSNPNNATSIPNHSPDPTKPNVVIIYADDMGFGDMSAYGTLFGTPSPAATPRMDSLASQGTLFTQAHSSNAVCSPSRYALLTGKYNWREFDNISGHYGVGPIPQIPKPGDVTIAEFLKTQAYDTAAFGKWHLGGAWYQRGSNTRITTNPTDANTVDWARPIEDHAVANGFDIFRGLAVTINFGPYVYLENDRVQYWDAALNGGAGAYRNATNADSFQYFTTAQLNSSVVGNKDSRASLGDPSYRMVDPDPRMISQVEQYLAARATSGDTDPFFTYVALYSPHMPWALTAPFVGADSSRGFYYSDWMREVDDRIGRVIAAIDNNGFRDNTVVILTSDNGPEDAAMSQSLGFGMDPNGPLRGNKRDVWDGGTRVPFVVRWPGQAAAGMKITDPIWQGDFFATIAAFLGTELPATTAPDGESFLNLIRGQRKPLPCRDSIVVSSIRRDLGLKTVDGWKFIDATGGGDGTSWDSSNRSIPNATGTDQGIPKQLFHLDLDLGEDTNLISSLTNPAQIRSQLTSVTGNDLLGRLDQYRTTTAAEIFPRRPDNDADGMPNHFETTYTLDRDNPKDATNDPDGDGQSNLQEFIAGTDPTNARSLFRTLVINNTVSAFSITWPSTTGRNYKVYWTPNFTDWHLYSQKTGTGAILSETLDKATIDAVDGITGNLNRCFVRVTASEN